MNYYPYQQPMQYQQPMGQLEQLRQQPFQQYYPQQTSQQVQNSIVWVRSEMEARNYPVAPNNSVTFWHENGLEIYLKKADASGRPDFEVYDVIKRSTPVAQQSNNPNDEIITLGKLMAVLNNLGLMPGKFAKETKEESVNE